MRPVVINGDVWRVLQTQPDSPFLIDRTGLPRLATTDPINKVIQISSNVTPPLLDKVMLHEVAHAITISHGLLPLLRENVPSDLWVAAEEWAVSLVENHGIEAIIAASESLGRPLCINGNCM